MMQLGDIAAEATQYAVNARLAEKWYLQSARGCPPQSDALFQLARMHHEVRQMREAFMIWSIRRHGLPALGVMLIESEGRRAQPKLQYAHWLLN